ncbi:MAG: hypothetical protein ACK52S_16260 [Pirellula sp.]
MTAGNRATKYENLHKSLKKHFKPVTETPERSVLEHLIYACCLEDAKHEQADEAFAKLQQAYFDWNEVRVTTIAELGEALQGLLFPAQAATRIKQCLQSLFESRYQYDIDDMKKANLGKSIADLEAWKGMTPFILSYVSQHALGGHSIPAGNLTLEALVQCEIITTAEAEKRTLPGVERAIPKNKGTEFASLLHQLALEMHLHPKGALSTAVLKDLGVSYKQKEKKPPTPVAPATKKTAAPSPAKPTGLPKAEVTAGQSGDGKKGDSKPQESKKPEVKTTATEAAKSAGAKKPAPLAPSKPSAAKPTETKPGKKESPSKPTADKPAAKKDNQKKEVAKKDSGKKDASPKPTKISSKPDTKSKSPSKSSNDKPASKPKHDAKAPTKKGNAPAKGVAKPSVGASITKKKPK